MTGARTTDPLTLVKVTANHQREANVRDPPTMEGVANHHSDVSKVKRSAGHLAGVAVHTGKTADRRTVAGVGANHQTGVRASGNPGGARAMAAPPNAMEVTVDPRNVGLQNATEVAVNLRNMA